MPQISEHCVNFAIHIKMLRKIDPSFPNFSFNVLVFCVCFYAGHFAMNIEMLQISELCEFYREYQNVMQN